MGTRRAPADVTGGERHRQQSAPARSADLQRSGRASFCDRVGDGRERQARDDRPTVALDDESGHSRRPAASRPGGLVPRLLACHLRRRASRARRIHLRGRPEPRTCSPVRDSVDLRNGRDATACRRADDRVPVPHGGDRALRVARADRATGRPPCFRDTAASGDDRICDRLVVRRMRQYNERDSLG